METAAGRRDHQIALEAFTGNFDLLISNNVNSIDQIGLQAWLDAGNGERLDVASGIKTPADTLVELSVAYQKPREWLGQMAASAAVTDPYDERQAARELEWFVRNFAERGLSDVRKDILYPLRDAATFDGALEYVRRRGRSTAARFEADKTSMERRAMSRTTGVSERTLAPPLG